MPNFTHSLPTCPLPRVCLVSREGREGGARCAWDKMEHFLDLVDVSRESCELVDVVCELWRVMKKERKKTDNPREG